MPEQTFTIDVPGVQDVIKIPALEDKNLRLERIKRYRTKETPLPDPLQWIPDVINMLDDAQDIIATFLTLAKPLIRRMPLMFVPGLGWVLLAIDVLNLSTAALGLVTTGKVGKKEALNTIESLASGRARRLGKVRGFLAHTNWFGFTIEAGQVLDNFTGYGLQLGPIMGLWTDAVWGLLRAGEPDTKIEIRGPPPSDIISKAGRFLMKAPQMEICAPLLNSTDKALWLIAQKAASEMLLEVPEPPDAEDRIALMEKYVMPVRGAWNEATIEALKEEGLDLIPKRACAGEGAENTRFGEASRIAAKRVKQWETNIAEAFGGTSHGTIMGMLGVEMAESNASKVEVESPKSRIDQTKELQILLYAVERGVLPYWWPSPSVFSEKLHSANTEEWRRCVMARNLIDAFIEDVWTTMLARASPLPAYADLTNAAITKWRGFKGCAHPQWPGTYSDDMAKKFVWDRRARLGLSQEECTEAGPLPNSAAAIAPPQCTWDEELMKKLCPQLDMPPPKCDPFIT